jgi:hypothetical protein
VVLQAVAHGFPRWRIGEAGRVGRKHLDDAFGAHPQLIVRRFKRKHRGGIAEGVVVFPLKARLGDDVAPMIQALLARQLARRQVQ